MGTLTACEGSRSSIYLLEPETEGPVDAHASSESKVDGESFTEAVAEDLCDLYMGCGHVANWNSVMECEASIFDEFIGQWSSGDCAISQGEARACLDYIGNLECTDLDALQGEATPCSVLCG